MQFTNVTPAAIPAHMVTTYGRIQARVLKRNLINIARPWDPNTNIETVYNHGALCWELAAEGGNPITDASYVLILVKIFRESGVFPMEIHEWSRLPDADKTVEKCMTFFTEAYENRMEETLQGALRAQAAKAVNITPTTTPPVATQFGKWDYCWSHGLCQHSGHTCRYPHQNHKSEATLDNPMGGSSQIRFPGQRHPPGWQQKHDKPAIEGVAATATTAKHVSSITDE